METNKNSINSIGAFNLTKGILMLAVVLGHTITLFFHYWEPQYTSQWWYYGLFFLKAIIYGLIPMFFLISGYGYYRKPLEKSVKARFKYLIKPYLVVSIVVCGGCILKKIIMHESIKLAFWEQILPYLLGLCPGDFMWHDRYIGTIGPLWFLVALALASVLLDIIFVQDSEVMRGICVLVLVSYATRLPFYHFIPYCIIQALCCMGYMYIGYLAREMKLFEKHISRKNIVVLLVLLCPIMLFGNIEVSQNVWQLGMLDFVGGAIAGFLFLGFFLRLNVLKGGITKVVRELGKNSLYVLCVHSVEYQLLPWQTIRGIFGEHIVIGIIASFLARGMFIVAGVKLISKLVKKIRRKKRKRVTMHK